MGIISNSLSDEEIDILKEVGNICVGNSTGILSQLLGGMVEVNLPSLEMITVEDLSDYLQEKGKTVYGVNAGISSNVEGSIFLLFPEKDSLKIIEKFLSHLDTAGINTIQFGISIIKEVGGIAIFSYVNTLSSLMKKLALTSVPNFLSGTTDELLSMILRDYENWGKVCVIHTSFKELSLGVEGDFYLILNKNSTEIIVKEMRSL